MRAINEGVYDYEIATDTISYSPRIYEVLEVSRRELQTAADWRRLIHPEDLPAYLAAFAAHVKGSTPRFVLDHRYRGRHGAWRWARQSGLALRDSRGRAVRLIGSIGDITDLKRAEAALRASEERYELAMSAVNEGVYDWDIASGEVYFSEGVHRVLGLSPGELRSTKDWLARVHPDDLRRYLDAHAAHFKGRSARLECEYRYRAEDGSWRWARTHGIARRDASGRAVRMIGSTGDITELKRIEQALKESEERQALAMRAATEGIYEWNLETGSLYLSERAKEFFAVQGDALTPAAWNARVHGEDFQGYRDAIARYFKGDPPHFEHEYRIRNMRGGYAWVLDRAVAVRDPTGRVTRMVGALADVTQRKHAEIELRQARDEATEALGRQTATAEILRVISSTPTNTQPVFEAIVESGLRVLPGTAIAIALVGEDAVRVVATGGYLRGELGLKVPAGRESATGIAIADRCVVHVRDTEAPDVPPLAQENGRRLGYRSMAVAPMLRESRAIGAISVLLKQTGGLPDKQLELLRTFADQAVIAIENVRLFNETKEALERQTATTEILRVISSTPTNAQPVFDAIVANAQRIIAAKSVALLLRRGQEFFVAAYSIAGLEEMPVELRVVPLDRDRNFPSRVILNGEILHVPDWEANEIPEHEKLVAKAFGFGAGVQVPLMRKGEGIGALVVSRAAKGPFSDEEIALLQSFADQAVIAIENVRLFNETREALEQQTATAGILRVISRTPTDTQPVFDAIVESGLDVFAGTGVGVAIVAGDRVRIVAAGGVLGPMAKRVDMPLSRESATGAAIVDRTTVNIEDTEAPDAPLYARENGRALGFRAITAAPMLREGQAIGAIGVVQRDPGGLTDKQMELLKTFADQAVIAIENMRLFNETKEALERQTATAEILQVIGRSPTDTQPVFDAIVNSGVRLFPGAMVTVALPEGGAVRAAAIAHEDTTMVAGWRERFTTPLSRDRLHAAAILDARLIDVPDAEAVKDGPLGPGVRNFLLSGNRAVTIMPMLRGECAIGAISVTRAVPGPLSDKQVALLKTFADQAVIAIENVRLFKELQQKIGQMTALREVGQAVSSTLDVDTVLKTIVQHAVKLTGLDAGGIYEYDEGAEEFRLRAAEGMGTEVAETLRSQPIRKGEGAVGGAAVTREPVQVTDVEVEGYDTRLREILLRSGRRAVLAVPLLHENRIVGALAVQKAAPGPFAPEVVELLKTFATQSAMAIQNARLFREIAEKGKQLEEASKHKSQFLASMSHELRTPLNAILGFNEMIIDQVYGEVPEDMRAPLENIQSSGKHLLRLINNVLDLAKIEAGRMELALSDYLVQDTVASVHTTLKPLAAEKGLEFVAEVAADIPPAHGDAGRIAQCLMNLAGNSLKFTRQGRVAITVAQRDGLLCFSVADTGIGIPPEKIASLFTEFKQTDATIASEYGGTGLGLSITKKFIEMHGGRIWVESELGKGSTFLFEIPLKVAR